jgi:hypothetical protein
MNRSPNRHIAATPCRPSRYGAAIEWEELPSFAQRRAPLETGRTGAFQKSAASRDSWDVTLPAALDPLHESGPFEETLRGLVTRELREPDVFRHFFS